MRVLFCADPLNDRMPDFMYETEAAAARAAGLDYDLIQFEALVNGDDAQRAVRRVRAGEGVETAIFRGWMMRPQHYALLYAALEDKGLRLINSPAAYLHTHHLPESYSVIESMTPKTVWLPADDGFSREQLAVAVASFGDAPLIVKDFVKSRKHEWLEACYIPSARDLDAVERVVRRFVQLQGDDLAGGLVFREYVDLEYLSRHSKSGMPLAKEYRLFFLNGQLLRAFKYWSEGDYGDRIDIPLDRFNAIAQQVNSRFFTMDVARTVSGEWVVIELGDGQVAGLPDPELAPDFYSALAAETN